MGAWLLRSWAELHKLCRTVLTLTEQAHVCCFPCLCLLQESDRDLQQALRHIEVLQRQLSASSAAPATASRTALDPATPSSAEPGTQASDAEAGQQGSGSNSNGPTAAGPELGFLRSRVHELSAENRALRRQALQLRLSAPSQQQAEGTAQGEGGAASCQQGRAQEGAGEPGTPGQQQQEGLREQLTRAELRVTRLQKENEQLMEMSNALRSVSKPPFAAEAGCYMVAYLAGLART